MDSRQILAEKHFDGRDYRLLVVQGELVRVVERVPAAVVADGVRTVRALLDAVNRNPRRGTGPNAILIHIDLDDEAIGLLSAAGVSADDVPESGRTLRLRRTANVSRGAMPADVTDNVHPDNARMAKRIAAILRLDIAGIGLLIPDISRSWMESGGVVCEVNAQPGLRCMTAGSLCSDILQKVVPRNGRIAVAVVVGGADGDEAAAAIAALLRAGGKNAAWAGKTGA